MTAFKPGQHKPENSGRTKGTSNRQSEVVLGILRQRGFEPVAKILDLIANGQLDDSGRLGAWLKLLPFCYPTLKSIEVVDERENALLDVTPDNVATILRIARESTPITKPDDDG